MTDLSDAIEEMTSLTSRELILEKIKNLLDAVKVPENIKDIPNLPLHDFRDLSVNEAELITELLKVKTIKDLSKVTYSQIMNRSALLKEVIPLQKLELLITAAKYIVKAAEYKPAEGRQKVVVAGLDNAGKTALLNTIKKEVGFSELSSLKPTKGACRDEVFLADQEILLIELGGQEEFRKFYIEAPDRFFLETDIIVYLIDIQDEERYQESLEYLQKILRTLKYLQESPDFIIIFSKSDPDVVSSPMYQEKYDYLEQKIAESFQPYEEFQYEIQTSSIYNIVSMTPSFSRMLKGLFSGSALAEEEKIGAIGKLLMKVVDLFLDTENHLNHAINVINQRLSKIESRLAQLSKGKIQEVGKEVEVTEPVHSVKVTPTQSIKKSQAIERKSGVSVRAALLNELKQVFGVKFGGKKE
ncbi:MAG: ADP-ribosylation factor-like protein [Candidatus Helarchaeota archaeon]